MPPVTLSASEFQDRVGEALDRSLSQPVLITKHGRPLIDCTPKCSWSPHDLAHERDLAKYSPAVLSSHVPYNFCSEATTGMKGPLSAAAQTAAATPGVWMAR